MSALISGSGGKGNLYKPIVARRAPTSDDKVSSTGRPFIPGQSWADVSVAPNVIYFYAGGGTWETGGNAEATTSAPGIVELSTLAELQTGTAPAGAVPTANDVATVIAAVVVGAVPPATEIQQGIAELANQTEAETGTDDTRIMTALKVTQLLDSGNHSASLTTLDVSGTMTFTGGLDVNTTGAISLDADMASNFSVDGAGVDLTLASAAGRVIVNGEEAAANAITLLSAAGGIDADAALQINIASSQNAVDAIRINASAGGIDIDAVGAATEDINITNTGGSVVIAATENVADAIVLNASAGGIDILAAGAATEDIDITNTAGSIRLTSGEAVADSMVFSSAGGIDADAVGQVNIVSTQSAVDAIVIEATVGGIDILASGAAAGEDIDIIATGSSVNVTSTENAAEAIYIRANGGVSETIRLHADQGTGVGSINIGSDVGGITLTAGLATADAINLVSSNAAGGIDIDAGTAGVIIDTTGGISLDAAAASNFTATGAFDITIQSTAGSILLNAGEAVTDAINIDSTGGFDLDAALEINITSSEAAVADSIRIFASAADGGIDIDAGTGGITIDSTGAVSIDGAASSNFAVSGAGIDLTLDSAAGQLILTGGEAAANAVRVQADNAAGGIDVDAGTAGITIDTTGVLSLDSAGATNLTATGAFDVTINSTAGSVIVSASESAVDALQLLSTAGGIDILASGAAAGEDIDIIATGSSVNIQSTEAVTDAITINASNAAGGINASVGTGGFNIAGNLNLTSVATRISMNGGAATDFIGQATLVAGTVTVANTNIAATDRIMVTRSALNGTPALGFLVTTISAGASFTVAAYNATGAAVVTDVSSFDYVIVRQT